MSNQSKTFWVTEGTETRYEGELYEVKSMQGPILIQEYEQRIELSLPYVRRDGSPAFSQVVTVYKPQRKFGDGMHGAEINWCAMGSQPIAVTRQFATVMEIAATLATATNVAAGIPDEPAA